MSEIQGGPGPGDDEDPAEHAAETPGKDSGSYPVVVEKKPRRWLWWAAGILVLLVALLLALGLWAERQINPPGGRGPQVVISLPGEKSASGEASQLASAGVIHSPTLFKLYVKVKGSTPVEAGAYALHRNESYSVVLGTLAKGPPIATLTVPEGFTLNQIAARVGHVVPGHTKAGFLAVANSGAVRSPYEPAGSKDLEGLLFPDTYSVGLQESDSQILHAMVDRFDENASTIGLDQAPTKVGISPYQAVIVASMVEREAKLDADRGKVAQVVYNRLHDGMKLQIDATVIYGLGGQLTSVTDRDLAIPTPYNTYMNAGLPPTPIANPGSPSLEAAVSPTAGPWLYYVLVSQDGSLAFATTYAQQLANQAIAKERGLG